MRFIYLLLSLLSFATAAEIPNYTGLAEGVEWVKEAVITRTDGQVFKSVVSKKVEGKVERDGKTYFKVVEAVIEGPGPKPMTILAREDATGVYSINLSDSKPAERPFLLFPLEAGKSWPYESEKTRGKTEVVGFEDIVVNDKTYKNCLHTRLTLDSGKVVENRWDAPGIGLVKAELDLDGLRVAITLREYKVKKAAQ